MVLMVVCIEGVVRHYRTTFTGYNALSWGFTRAQVATRASECDVLCLGDSRVKYGLVPQLFEETIGKKAFNLALTAGRAPASYFLLKNALAAGAPPRAIVVDFDEKLLSDDPMAQEAPPPWADLLGGREALELEHEAGASGFATRTVLEQILHTLKNRFEIRSNVTQAIQGKSFGRKQFHEVTLRNWTVNQGAQVNMKREFEPPPPPAAPPSGPVEAAWKPHPLNLRYIERFLALAEERGIPVYWLLPPRCPSVQLWRDWNGEESCYDRFVAGLVGHYPNLVVLDARHSGYETDVFVDIVHLDRDGAATLSHDIAVALEVIPTLEPKPRWAQLPRYQDVPVKVALEDIDGSRRALKIGIKGERQVDLIRRVMSKTPRLRDTSDDRLGELSRILR
jgi:hypothetical protein